LQQQQQQQQQQQNWKNKQTNEEGQDGKRSLRRQLNCIGIGFGKQNKQGAPNGSERN